MIATTLQRIVDIRFEPRPVCLLCGDNGDLLLVMIVNKPAHSLL